MRKFVLIIMATTILLSSCGAKGTMSKEKLEKYMRGVYAPQSMDDFMSCKEDSENYFNDAARERFFVRFSDELSETDKKRVCAIKSIKHGEKENQSDGIERWVVSVSLYMNKLGQPINKRFTFFVNGDNKIYDFKISDDNE